MATIVPDDDDVEQQLTKLMSQNSSLMKGARTAGLQQAQSVGLGQSTMGIKAAQAAAYNAAIPLASQAASQASQQKMQAAQFGQERSQQEALFGQQRGLQAAQFGQETGMQQSQFGFAASQAERDRQQQRALMERGAEIDIGKMTHAGNIEFRNQAERQWHEANLASLDRSSREWLANIEMSNANKERAAASLSSTNQVYSQGVAAIMQNPNLPADVRNNLLQHQEAIRNQNFNLTRSLFQNF